MTFHTYLLKCADGSYYAGHSDALEVRIGQHQSGETGGYTATRRPVLLVWASEFATRSEALEAERKIKGWTRAKKEALIRGDMEAVQRLAKKDFGRGRDPTLRYATSASLSGYSGRTDVSVHGDDSEDEALRLRSGRTDVGEVQPQQPVIVLVRPQLGENIGKAARAMLNFGLTEMRLVSPRDGWPNPSAGPAAAGADIVLADAKVFETLADAVADCAHVYATTVRNRSVTKPVVTPEEAAREMRAASSGIGGRSAFVFGPERSGLATEDVALARAIVTVPINPEFGSLNLAQAVILCAYEWSKADATLAQPTVIDLLPPAPQEELEGMIVQLDGMLVEAGFFYPPNRMVATRLALRNLLTKPGWNHLEVRTLRGVLSALAKPRRR